MPLSEKDVFNALLDNHRFTLCRLCDRAGLASSTFAARLNRNSLHKLSPAEMIRLSKAMGTSVEDLTGLLKKARRGDFPNDYPKENIVLNIKEGAYPNIVKGVCLDERTIPKMLTAEENHLIETIRVGREYAIKQALAKHGTQQEDE